MTDSPIFTLQTIERRTRPGAMPSLLGIDHGLPLTAQEGWYGEVTDQHDNRWQLSKLDGEAHWIVDAAFHAGSSMPAFMHGFGSRCTIPLQVGGDLLALLEAGISDDENALIELEAGTR